MVSTLNENGVPSCPIYDLKQASVVLASFLYHAAMRDEPLPRKPMPREDDEE